MKQTLVSTVEHGQLITKKYLSEHKVITAEQQFLGLILWFFMYLKWPWLLRLFAILLLKQFRFLLFLWF